MMRFHSPERARIARIARLSEEARTLEVAVRREGDPFLRVRLEAELEGAQARLRSAQRGS